MISIIIITLNEELYLPRLLESLSKQTYQDFEVIISDSNSDDRTKEVAMRYRRKFKRFKFERHFEHGVSAARNRGASFAKGEYLYFFDADVTFAPDFLEKSLQALRAKGIDAAAAYVWPRSKNPIDWLFYLFANLLFFLSQCFYPHAAGSSMMSRPIVHKVIGGFDPSIRLAGDADYARRAAKRFRFRMLPGNVRVSVRRFRTEGRLPLALKYLGAFFYRIFVGEIRNSSFHYKFAHYRKR